LTDFILSSVWMEVFMDIFCFLSVRLIRGMPQRLAHRKGWEREGPAGTVRVCGQFGPRIFAGLSLSCAFWGAMELMQIG
jgi:hypothetical protein